MVSLGVRPGARTFRYIAAVVVLTLTVYLGTSTACSGAKRGTGDQLTGSLTIAGSTSVQPLVEVLAENFRKKNPRVRVHVQGGGSTSGIRAVLSGIAQIGASSRALAADEKELAGFLVARDAIAVVVHPSNPVSSLSLEQIRGIYSGDVRDWREVGGREGPIVLVAREAGSGTRAVFEEAVMGAHSGARRGAQSGSPSAGPAGGKAPPPALVQNTTGAIRSTVAGDPRAIGYVSLPGIDRTVRAIRISGVEPTLRAVQGGRYPIAREFLLVTRGQPAGLARAFIDFALGPEGQAVVISEGLVPVRGPGVRPRQGRP